MYEHLKLSRWPFSVVPEPLLCDFIADRESFRNDVEILLRNFTRQSVSSIDPIWSWFGAGKTHTLHYIAHKADQLNRQGSSLLTTVYSEFPRNPSSFVEVYKAFARQLNRESLTDAYQEIITSPDASHLQQDLLQTSSDLTAALRVLVFGENSDQELAMRWLCAEALPVAECRKLGISRRITTSEDSTHILVGIIRAYALSARSQRKSNSRLIWLLDELQRINQLPPRVRHEINTGLHSTFNACPNSFTMILSFTDQPLQSLPDWFSPELKDRIGRTKVLILPPMDTNDALKFIRDVLEHSRIEGIEERNPYFPFTEATCKTIINDIKERDDLKPRSIMQTFNVVLQQADFEIESGRMSTISPAFSQNVLTELVGLN